MKNRIFVPLALFAVLAVSCTKSDDSQLQEPSCEKSLDPCLVPGQLYVEFSEEMTAQIEQSLSESGLPQTRSSMLNSAFSSLGVTSMERVYPDAGKFEPRHRQAGLHRWYKLNYDPSFPQTKASLSLEDIDGVMYVEPARVKKSMSLNYFNDPSLSEQWHYYNDGSKGSKYKAGADVNVVPVWQKFTAGRNDVIVAVIDSGVDLEHEDLADVCLPGGQNGSKCFVSGRTGYTIYPENHGTHVAGTIAAINNNGKGVCGIAGGNDGKGGVRIMSCQIMMTDPSDSKVTLQGDDNAAMVWAADHGAVISQNSWGYSYKSAEEAAKGGVGSIKSAIDYFIEYAGVDENGVQTGPMKGGVVIFAAGNDAWPNGWPAAYDKVIAVGAISASMTRAYYSNFGDWVDIAAPGGDANQGPQIFSCYAGGTYGAMQGTSMACPHVSGVAALIVSYFGGPGFTNEMLKERLLKGANPILPSGYQIGPLVDALGAFTYGGTEAPEPVADFSISSHSNSITCGWAITPDPDDGVTDHYLILASKDKSTLEAYKPGTAVPSNIICATVNTGAGKPGEHVEGTIARLEFETEYFVTIIAVDYVGNCSEKAAIKTITTGNNNPPTITPKASYDSPVQVRAHLTETLEFAISDSDGHSFSYEFDGGSPAASISQSVFEENTLVVKIVGAKAPAGSYAFTIKAIDAFGAEAELKFPYVIHSNHAPLVLHALENQVFVQKNETRTFRIGECFTDEDGERLSITAETSAPAVVHAFLSEDELSLTTLGFGATDVVVKATDTCGECVSFTFSVIVRDPALGPDIKISGNNLSINTYYTGKVDVTITNSAGAKVYAKQLDADTFNPIIVDMKACAPGVYNYIINYDGDSHKGTFVKK